MPRLISVRPTASQTRFRQLNTWFAFTSYCRATIETDEPGANDAATISRFSASGHERLRGRPVAVVPITDFVDTSCPHNTKNHITLGEMKRFRKAALGGGKPLFVDSIRRS